MNAVANDLARGRTLLGDGAPINDERLMLSLRAEVNASGADPDKLTRRLREKIAASPIRGKAPDWMIGDRRADAWSHVGSGARSRPQGWTSRIASTQRSAVSQTLRAITIDLGLRTENAHPRTHDLRHSFAVSTLLGWQQSGVQIDERIAVLSTYLGHVSPADTYWYLTATPELMGEAAHRLERHLGGRP